MARIRTIKPEFCEDEDIAKLPLETAHAFVLMWMFADDDGVVKANPRLLRTKLFPLNDNVTLEQLTGWLKILENSGFLIRFNHGSEDYFLIRNFSKHQRIEKKFKSKIPADVIKSVRDMYGTTPVQVQDDFGTSAQETPLDIGIRNTEIGNGKGTNARNAQVSDPTFDLFWDLYDKKVGLKKCRSRWSKLTTSEREAILDHVPKYVESKPEKQFRKDPIAYLNNNVWEDEIIEQKHGQPQTHIGNQHPVSQRRTNPTLEESLRRARDREAGLGITRTDGAPGETIQPALNAP